MDYQVECVCKENGHISCVVVIDSNGTNHCFKRTTVADLINQGHRFYTVDPATQKVADVYVYDHNRKLIKTAADWDSRNNLDNLPECQNCAGCNGCT